MILSSALRKKMEELALISLGEPSPFKQVMFGAFEAGFTAAVDELTKVPEDIEHLIDAHAVQEYNGLKQEINRNNFRYGANFFKSEIMPSLIEQARLNGIRESVEKLRNEKNLIEPNRWGSWLEREMLGEKK